MAKKVYIAGPMRGKKLYNFPEFDRVGGILLSKGYKVYSPADLDREHGFDPWALPGDHDWNTVPEGFDLKQAFFRDLGAVAAAAASEETGWTVILPKPCRALTATAAAPAKAVRAGTTVRIRLVNWLTAC